MKPIDSGNKAFSDAENAASTAGAIHRGATPAPRASDEFTEIPLREVKTPPQARPALAKPAPTPLRGT